MEAILTPSETQNKISPFLAELLGTSEEAIEISKVHQSETKESLKVLCEGKSYFAKVYSTDTDHSNDRLNQEWTFSRYVRSMGLQNIPAPIAIDKAHGIALYEFISGQHLKPEEFTASLLDEALSFHLALNENAHSNNSSNELPTAYDASFSLADYTDSVQKRMNRFDYILTNSTDDQKCKDFIINSLEPLWEQTKDHIQMAALKLGTPQNEKLADTDRCLSAADFGFHNMLIDTGGRAYFIDFEYAGWDDPARLICDFFHHPSFPVPTRYKKRFAEKALSYLKNHQWHFERLANLEPLIQIKWICILLNPFLAIEPSGHHVHNPENKNIDDLKNQRLNQAEALLIECEKTLRQVT
ncbi:MAG: phosphotransferase [Verrucomicrobiota bacterium]